MTTKETNVFAGVEGSAALTEGTEMARKRSLRCQA
jgi:hypothetical protein